MSVLSTAIKLDIYHKDGYIQGATNKTFCVDGENCLSRDHLRDPVTLIELAPGNLAAGLLCNDMWGYHEAGVRPLTTVYGSIPGVSLILHATNGAKVRDDDPSFEAFNKWHDGFLWMSAFSCGVPILTVDSCTPWDWDGKDQDVVAMRRTSSESGVIDNTGWKTSVPRYGRQYFYYDLTLPEREIVN